ncbi:hypothetical protein RGQ29_024472 [Quercus rubra]|uniref:Reverse transcriptase domain-containing protein n=1 Tax=Quercus rubra TaxID=3512 RepID=A0AAN7EX00_QUERU|nr:hypothetical protein RGQ29_024472 [Quercus rubra]
MIIHLRRINPLEFRFPNRSPLRLFSTLLQNPSPHPKTQTQNPIKTLTKPQLKVLSLLNLVSRRFDVEEMGSQLHENRFDIEACCVTMTPSKMKGESLVLPNLKLRVLIEAIRMVLEIVYDERVTFDRERFDDRHVNKLCLFIEVKIKDGSLIGLIKRLFECEVVRIDLGGCYLGRGFPQENGLCSILINIYFNGFDKEIQDMRLQKNQENPKFKSEQLVWMPGLFYKPVKMYVVRYLDEILVITSGSKMLTMDFKNWVLKYLEGRLDLKVDEMKTAIHNAVSGNISFLGMELQAVPPSKEVRALELKNARERNRKILRMKILQHVFKKSKQSDEFKFDFQIENEVREIFRTWTDEVIHDFLGSLEEYREWHLMLMACDFLSLRHIRDQSPQDLVDAYDKFQEQADKYLSSVQARKAFEKEEKRGEEEEEWKYAQSTIEDLTRLCMKVDAPIELVRKIVKMAGFTNNMGHPRLNKLLIDLEDTDIFKWYVGVGRRWLDFFCCCHNFKMETKKLEREVKMMGDQNLSDPRPIDGALSLALIRLASDEPSCSCIGHFCDRMDTIYYWVRLLQNRLNVNPFVEDKWVPGMGAIHESLNRKCLPLCSHHLNDLYMGNITLQDIDCTAFVDVD